MPQAKTEVDILIVGAGPVGLFLANECARRGLSFRIVETNAGQSEHSKALAIFPRTMEIFDMAGVVSPFLKIPNRVTEVAMIAHGRKLAHMQFEPDQSPYAFVSMVPQDVTEKLLVEELQRRAGVPEYETTFISAEQQGNSVVAALNHKGDQSECVASFVVGCDGAHSVVRHLLNIPFEGAEYSPSYALADIETHSTLPSNELQLCPSEFGPLAIFPMSATRRRIVATVDQAEGDAPSLDLVRRLLAQRAPKEIEALSLNWSSYFRIHHRHARTLRGRRMFLAGDAAHIHSPFGGQGMNTGLHDIWNLTWKLDLFLHGQGNEQLLDSYSEERLPIIQSVIDTTDEMTKVLGTPNRFAQTLRDAIIPMVSRLASFQHAFVQRLSELGIAYHGSPIVEGPGSRYWDDSIRGGNGICSRFLLILEYDAEAPAKKAAKQLVDPLSNVVELRFGRHKGVTLVRPDGYVAYSSHEDSAGALKHVQALLERQTRTDGMTERKTA